MMDRIFALTRDDRWHTMARAAVRDGLRGVRQQLTARVLETTGATDSAAPRVSEWEEADQELVERSASTLEEICCEETADLARLSGRLAGCPRPAVLRASTEFPAAAAALRASAPLR